ncbi:MAG: phosphoribosyl-AMP cyclohydrolase [bacterium]|nr:phosphoribosyl-AMP cyclohydrolase [bacterium]
MVTPDFKKENGLLPCIAQEYRTGRILMMAYMNEESYKKTLETGKVHYFSRSRNKLWLKGEQSGNFQVVKEIYLDCDNDTLLVKVEQIGKAACHTGYESCFFRKYNAEKKDYELTGEAKCFDPDKVYK